jgi:hypothetical protein
MKIRVISTNSVKILKYNRNQVIPVFILGVCGMDILISDGSERFSTKVGRFGTLKNRGSVRKTSKYCIKLQKAHMQLQT